MSAKVLVIEPGVSERSTMVEALAKYEVTVVASAGDAINAANDANVDLVIMELSLGGHSGMEFLYEFRTYADWQKIPVIVYSSLRVDDAVLKSRAWQQLNISDYLYKPASSLERLKRSASKVLG